MALVIDSETTAEKPGLFVRAFIIVLPLGLALMVPVSLWIYYKRKYQPEPAASQYSAMLRRELNAEDFARYAQILAVDIGERSVAKPDALEAASAFVESTLGYDNMGYAIQKQGFEVAGKPLVNLIAELPGHTKPQEQVLVIAAYDEADASGIAALMSLAHALTGTEHARTIRFAAVVHAETPEEQANGLYRLLQPQEDSETRVVKIIALTPPSLEGKLAKWSQAAVLPFGLAIRDQSARPMEVLHKVLATTAQEADAP
ncbi:MAG: hypothetical protein ACOYMN_18435 [Roseimicrobium sp.]